MTTISDTITALASIFLVLSTVTIATRFYVRAFMIRSIGADDYVMGFAYLSYVGYLVSQLVGVHYGIGKHSWELDRASNESALNVRCPCP